MTAVTIDAVPRQGVRKILLRLANVVVTHLMTRDRRPLDEVEQLIRPVASPLVPLRVVSAIHPKVARLLHDVGDAIHTAARHLPIAARHPAVQLDGGLLVLSAGDLHPRRNVRLTAHDDVGTVRRLGLETSIVAAAHLSGGAGDRLPQNQMQVAASLHLDQPTSEREPPISWTTPKIETSVGDDFIHTKICRNVYKSVLDSAHFPENVPCNAYVPFYAVLRSIFSFCSAM